MRVFVTYVVLYSISFTLLFICITNSTDIIFHISQHLLKYIFSKPVTSSLEVGDAISEDTTSDEDVPAAPLSVPAYVQGTILYFQVVSLLKVKMQDGRGEVSSTEVIREYVSNFFNFRFVVYQGVCPSDDLILPEKEMIIFGIKMISLIHLLLIGIAVQMLRRIFCNTNSPEENLEVINAGAEAAPLATVDTDSTADDLTNSDDSNDKQNDGNYRLSFVHRLEITFVKLLKLYYTPITKSSLEMIHCVQIMGTYHLFVYGDHICYSYWQLCIVGVVLPGILLFPISFELAIRLLRKKLISSFVFTMAVACPYYSLVLYSVKVKFVGRLASWCVRFLGVTGKQTKEDEGFTQKLLTSEEDLFVRDDQSLSWQVVQFYRTFTINIITIFVTNPLYRSIVFAPVLLIFLVHDGYRQPYKNIYLNQLQSLSSRCLLLVLTCNVVASASYMVDVTFIPGLDVVVGVLSVVEMMLYAVVPLSVPVSLFVEYVSRVRKYRKKVRRHGVVNDPKLWSIWY